MAAVALLAVVVRLRTLQLPSAGGDAFEYVLAAKHLAYGVSAEHWTWGHHNARFGIVLPAAFAYWISGDHIWAYYFVPLTSAMGVVLATYAVGHRLHGPALALLAATTMALFPPMQRFGSQIGPEAPGALCLLTATYAMLRTADEDDARRRLAWLLALSGACFAAYMIWVPTVFAFPGLWLGLWICGGRRRDVATVAASCAALFWLEWTAYFLFTEETYGRIGIIASGHLDHRNLKEVDGASSLLKRFKGLEPAWYYVLVPGLVSWGGAVVQYKPCRRLVAATTAGITFLVGVVFAVKSLDPLVPVLPFRARYFFITVPFGTLAFWWIVVRRTRARVVAQPDRPPPWRTIGLLLVGSSIVFPKAWKPRGTDHALEATLEDMKLAERAHTEGWPVLVNGGDTRTLMRGYIALYWQGDRLEGLPRTRRAKIGDRTYRFLVDPEAAKHTRQVRRHALAGGTVLRLRKDQRRDPVLGHTRARFQVDETTLTKGREKQAR